jgi:SH3-like domain-containing protein
MRVEGGGKPPVPSCPCKLESMVTESGRSCLDRDKNLPGCIRRNPSVSWSLLPTRYIYEFSCDRMVKLQVSFRRSRLAGCAAVAATLLLLLTLAGCNRRHRVLEVAYVSAPQATLRDQVAQMYNRVGTVKNGDRVEILDHEKRFALVRTASGVEGWIEQRNLVEQKIFDALEKLTQDHRNDPPQAPGVLRNDTNLHITPGRETEHLYQLATGAKVAILGRATAEKQGAAGAGKAAPAKPGAKPATGPPLEDWWLVRDDQGRVGWVLARMVDVDVPLEIAQYAEGQRFVAFFALDEVQDGDKKVPEYVCLLAEPHDGLPYDFDQVRVFTWNVRKHRYETAYREHGFSGILPVTISKEQFDKEGTLPVFQINVRDDQGNVAQRKYKLNTPIVRRVLAPGEVVPRPTRRKR